MSWWLNFMSVCWSNWFDSILESRIRHDFFNFRSCNNWAPEISDKLFSSYSKTHLVDGSEDSLFFCDEQLVDVNFWNSILISIELTTIFRRVESHELLSQVRSCSVEVSFGICNVSLNLLDLCVELAHWWKNKSLSIERVAYLFNFFSDLFSFQKHDDVDLFT